VPSIYSFVGPVPIVEYATPNSVELANFVGNYIRDYDSVILANHGSVTAGKDLRDAFYKTERLELLCTATVVARLLGGEKNFTNEEIRLLNEKKERQIKEGLA
jgi:L-fuculose-phosphate aldolase